MKLLVFGGSQGSLVLNRAFVEALPLLKVHLARPVITHQTGPRWLEEVEAGYREAGYEATVVPFIKGMADAVAAADLIVCRAGATSVAELAAAGRGALLVPFAAAAGDHQTFNARLLEQAGAAEVLTEAELSGAALAARLTPWLEQPTRLVELGERARKLARPDAAGAIADMLMRGLA